ncbi:MAG: LCP family protein [Chloroflexi bacterium]|nr:LCP family protein [Chloroflexota bacterium]
MRKNRRIITRTRIVVFGLTVLLALSFLAAGCHNIPLPITPTETLAPTETPTVAPTAAATPPPTSTLQPTRTPRALTRTPKVTAPPEATATKTRAPTALDFSDNFLVLGMDARPGETDWRTDTIMVVAIDHQQGQIGIISIPRDLYVDVPGVGETRINVADYYGEATDYPGGGPALLRRVLTETLGIPTLHYVRIRMDGLVRLVDALGGVTVTLDCPLYERTPDDSSPNGLVDWNLPAGQVHLDGQTAKKFATYRYVTSDFGRAHRQQQLIWAIRDRALQLDVIPKIPELWKALADTFTTDLGLVDVVKLAQLGVTLKSDKVHGLVFSTEALDYFVTEEGAWVLVLRDRDKLDEEKAQLFSAQPLAQLGQQEPGGCPPPPTPVPTFTPTPAVSPTPSPIATPAA